MRKWTPSEFKNFHHAEHDSCGIVAIVNKDNAPTHQNILNAVDALIKMEHRSGFINGEGDGCGLLTDIPRSLWSTRFEQADLPANLVYSEEFFVAHLFIPTHVDVRQTQKEIRELFDTQQANIYLELENQVDSSVLGPNGKQDEPLFWQISGSLSSSGHTSVAHSLFELQISIEEKYDVHVASLNNQSCVYKVMGAANILPKYFKDLGNAQFESTVSIGHNRYSTNTLSNFFRVQPFSLLGHNGEINTVNQLRQEAQMIGAPLDSAGSDSQDLNRTIETLIHRYHFSLFEALEMVFPPIINEIKNLNPKLQDLYVDIRQTWGHFAQGPAGIVSRYQDECVFSIDSLGLRPLWVVETDEQLFFSSEQGLVPATEMIAEPKSLAPGEKVGVKLQDGMVVVYQHHELQEEVYDRYTQRKAVDNSRKMIQVPSLPSTTDVEEDLIFTDQWYGAFGWDRDHIQLAEQMASNGADPVRSLGHDGPLAALTKERQNIADYLKESVAVVTNPAIDREREMEHFSTRVVLGSRSVIEEESSEQQTDKRVELYSPILLEGVVGEAASPELETLSYEQVIAYFEGHVHTLDVTCQEGQESLAQAIQRLQQEAASAVIDGAQILILDDRKSHADGHLWIDPHLIVSAIDQHLVHTRNELGISLRRKTSIILRSAAIRSLHDIAVASGLGANAVNPYLLFATVSSAENADGARHLFSALNKGLEKVTSTIGIHELRGYNRIFSGIGLRQEIADLLQVVSFCGSEQIGLGFEQLEEDARKRALDFADDKTRAGRTFRIFPRVWKPIGQIAKGELDYSEYAEKVAEIEEATPISIRHVTDLNFEKANQENSPVSADDVSVGVGEHDLPFVISSMSFGSQNETAYRAYAEAAEQLNMISINGEGGEIKDMLGKYPRTRGLQVASGRFGVNVELANSSNLLEIKIGQGAKPGEGGHLPGSKVTAKIAAARNATIGSDLISPSNNHDIYSIEDLAQIITELKTANHEAKVIVKVPIVPNIGTISVGIAKAGADVVSLSGFDGGTGAARIHALQHVGLPVELGVKLAHHALIEAGLRDQVEVWGDGGIKSSLDALKVMLLGANRVGFGTLSMIAVGCTACRGCHLDTCHVGIATQIDSQDEAAEKGLKRFIPRELDLAVSGLKTMFSTFGQELQRLTGLLGYKHAQELVGRSDLLQQVRELEKLDLTALLAAAQEKQAKVAKLQKVEKKQEQKLALAAGAEHQVESNPYVSFDQPLVRDFSDVLADQRVLGSRYAGERVKNRLDGSYLSLPKVELNFDAGSVPGNGLAAFNVEGIHIRVQGGAQDGVGKTSFGGVTSILKAKNKVGQFINGSVGKGFCYGAQKGLFIVQGNADSRAGIRLSGADVIIAGEVTSPLQDELGGIGARANIKGFAFEYMTNGRALVLGDPGPWICSGMTGGVVYLRLDRKYGLDEAAIYRRIAKAAKISLESLSEKGKQDVSELLGVYIEELLATGQQEKAAQILELKNTCSEHFIQLVPIKQQADPSVSTE
ncbi:glutamate synthase-related protein [Bacillus horti]|uniref:Glutamate synthase (NADPH/NADH) large chain n=1 Tax=Caldalkalibacillus horti TaxID=77523 RepID=A0ABT9W1E0_9BACI|nr:glutamate synthase-related protein [Bacillus horti]MDQ0167077.1 glutamate synthase (NADPH/NADH) large chain [Bacillus horti]